MTLVSKTNSFGAADAVAGAIAVSKKSDLKAQRQSRGFKVSHRDVGGQDKELQPREKSQHLNLDGS
jgi:hypothetical protein